MSTDVGIRDLMEELAVISMGKCIWCTLKKPHPEYSRCAKSEYQAGNRGKYEMAGTRFIEAGLAKVA